MTGIERLRGLGNDYAEHSWSEAGKSRGMLMLNIADQIERERTCDEDAIENVRLIVGGVIDDMERHCLGHEGMEDSPVARWARELRDALKSDTSEVGDTQTPSWHDPADDADVTSEAKKVTRDPAEDVSMSAYDLLPADERDAIAWVRERGGLDYVKREWRSRVPHDRYEARRQRLLGHIAECETALGRRREIISKLTHRVSDLTCENAELRRRAMPEGVKWPQYESGELVGFGDEASRLGEVFAICLYCDGSYALNFRAYSKGERVRRPAVLAADGEPLEVGQTVWHVDGRELTVTGLPKLEEYQGVAVKAGNGFITTFDPCLLTHQRPVLDADGVPIELGDDLYSVEGSLKIHVSNIDRVNCRITTSAMFALDKWADPSMFTHTKPDSWDALWDDIENCAVGYESFMRRCKALAERGEQQ